MPRMSGCFQAHTCSPYLRARQLRGMAWVPPPWQRPASGTPPGAAPGPLASWQSCRPCCGPPRAPGSSPHDPEHGQEP